MSSVTSAPIIWAPSNWRSGIEDRLDEAFRLTERNGLAVADEGEAADLQRVAGLLGLALGKAHGGDLRQAIGAARNRQFVERVV